MTIRLGDLAPDFEQDFDGRPDPLPRMGGRQLGGAVLASEGFHARMHDRARRRRQAEAGIREAGREGDRPVGRPARLAPQMGRRHRGNARRGPQLPAPRRFRPQGLGPLRHDPSERERHLHGALGFRDRPSKKVRLTLTYPAATGRSFEELLRVIDSLQLTDKFGVATPADWSQGEDVIIVPAVTDEQAKVKFPNGWKTLKPYLRVTPQPGA